MPEDNAASRILGWHNGKPIVRIDGGADPPPDAPPVDPVAPPTADNAPTPPAPAVRRAPPSRSAPPSTSPPVVDRDQALAALGVDPDRWGKFEKWQTEWEAKQPEIERIRGEVERYKRDALAKETALRQAEQQFNELAKVNFALYLSGQASELGRTVNIVPEAAEDLYVYLDRHTHTQNDGAQGVTAFFRDGATEIDLNAADATKKLAEHVTKARPHWLTSRMAAGGGGVGRPAQLLTRNEPPKTKDEFVNKLAMQIVNGGRQAAGR